MTRFKNQAKQNFLASIPTCSIEHPSDSLSARCKFNFSYFEHQAAGQDFSQWSKEQLVAFMQKLKEFTRESLDYWTRQPVGKTGSVLSLYGGFPARSEFVHPKHVPHEACWARFRLDWSSRLCGFVIPKAYAGKQHNGYAFCANTFYVVFLDDHHKFYLSKDRGY